MATCHAATPCNTINISSCRSLRISYEAPCPNVCVWGILRHHHIQALFYWMGWRTYRERVCQCTASTRCQRSACFNYCGCASGWSKPYSLSLSAKAVSNKSLCCFASPKIPCKARRLGYGDKALGVRKEIKIPIIRRSTSVFSDSCHFSHQKPTWTLSKVSSFHVSFWEGIFEALGRAPYALPRLVRMHASIPLARLHQTWSGTKKLRIYQNSDTFRGGLSRLTKSVGLMMLGTCCETQVDACIHSG